MYLRKPLPTPRTQVLRNKAGPPPSSKAYTESHKEAFGLEASSEYKELPTNLTKSDNQGVCNYNLLNIQCGLTPSPSQSALYASVEKKRSSGGESNMVAFLSPELEPVEYEQIEITKIEDKVENKVRKAICNEANSKVNSIYEASYYNLWKAARKGDMNAKKGEQIEEAENKHEEEQREGYYSNIKRGKGKQMVLEQIAGNETDAQFVEQEEQRRKCENEKVITKLEKDEGKYNKSKTKEEETENLYGSNENIYEPMEYFQQNISFSSLKALLKPKALSIIEPIPPIPPRRKEEMKLQTRFANLDLIFSIKDFLDMENDYIARIEEALKISEELKSNRFSREGVLNYFGLLEDIHTFHKQILLKDLELCTENPQNIPTLFVNHAPKFHVYIERQRLIPNKTDLSSNEETVINERKLERYVNITKERISEYIKTLQHLKYKYNDNSQKTNREAIRMLENIYYQLEMIENLKKVEDIYNKFKECGEIYLDRTFKVSINGTRKQDYLVYLCENIIIFTIFKKDNSYHYVLDIPIARCYCCVMKQSNIFEIGIKGKKRLTMEAESQAIKRRWCEQLKKVLNLDLFQEI